MLDKLDELGIADNTIVMYSTDNGPENDTWPDGANTPFRSQKDTNWEGGWRVPSFIRWPGKIKAGTVLNGIVSHQDMLPTLLAIAGDPDVNEKLLNGHKVGDKTVQGPHRRLQHGAVPHRPGEGEPANGLLLHERRRRGRWRCAHGDWKFVLAEQRAQQMRVWMEPLVKLRLPLIFNLRRDPFERAAVQLEHLLRLDGLSRLQLYEMQALVAAQIEDFEKFPPRQKPASFNLDAVMRQVEAHH